MICKKEQTKCSNTKTLQKMINYDDIDIQEHNSNSPQIPDYP